MTMLKTVAAQVKAVEPDDSGEGVIEALVATYDLDSGGDRIVPGAFAKTLDDWQSSGHLIPFVWSHMHDDIDAYLGDVTEARETDEGLWVKAQIDMTDEKARKAFRLIKGGRVRQYSFAYEVIDAEDTGDEVLLRELKLYEVGPTLIGMNQATRTLVVKQQPTQPAQLKSGRVLSAANETSLRDAHDAIGRVLAQLDATDAPSSNNEEAAQPTEPMKVDERASVKADESMQRGPADDDLASEVHISLMKGPHHHDTA